MDTRLKVGKIWSEKVNVRSNSSDLCWGLLLSCGEWLQIARVWPGLSRSSSSFLEVAASTKLDSTVKYNTNTVNNWQTCKLYKELIISFFSDAEEWELLKRNYEIEGDMQTPSGCLFDYQYSLIQPPTSISTDLFIDWFFYRWLVKV